MEIKKLVVLQKNGEQNLLTEGEVFTLRKGDSTDTKFDVLLLVDGNTTKIGTPFIEKHGVVVEFLGEKKKKVETRRFRNKSRYRKNKSHTDVFYTYKVTNISLEESKTTPVKKLAASKTKKEPVAKKPVKKETAKKVTNKK